MSLVCPTVWKGQTARVNFGWRCACTTMTETCMLPQAGMPVHVHNLDMQQPPSSMLKSNAAVRWCQVPGASGAAALGPGAWGLGVQGTQRCQIMSSVTGNTLSQRQRHLTQCHKTKTRENREKESRLCCAAHLVRLRHSLHVARQYRYLVTASAPRRQTARVVWLLCAPETS